MLEVPGWDLVRRRHDEDMRALRYGSVLGRRGLGLHGVRIDVCLRFLRVDGLLPDDEPRLRRMHNHLPMHLRRDVYERDDVAMHHVRGWLHACERSGGPVQRCDGAE